MMDGEAICLLLVVMSFMPHVGTSLCAWPDFMSLPRRHQNSFDRPWHWQTDTKLDVYGNETPEINTFPKSRTMIFILGNDTIQRRLESSDFSENSKEYYRCVQAFGNDTYLLGKSLSKKRTASLVSYRCVQFLPKSKFVVLWRWGAETHKHISCDRNFTEISPWPLVYWPLRENSNRYQIFRFREIVREYQECPRLGGFLMRIYGTNGTEIPGCENDFPSPRFELECGGGEGLQMTPSNKGCSYSFSEQSGAKLYCIGSWKDGNYSFSVLVPAHESQVNSFHCLRINDRDPTCEPAVIFLDTICKTGVPDPLKESYFTVELRRKDVQGMCQDFSDQCDSPELECSNAAFWSACMKTCGRCHLVDQKFTITRDLRGRWIVQRFGNQSEVVIKPDHLTFPGLGKFDAYSDKPDKSCIKHEAVFRGAPSYVLGQVPGHGCFPRVMQFKMKRLSPSVAIMHISGTSVIRNDNHASSPSQWCWNNAMETTEMYKVYQPYWPYTAHNEVKYDTGWYTMIQRNAPETAVHCDIWYYFKQILVEIEFNIPGRTQFTCRGRTRQEGINGWEMEYNNCSNGETGKSLSFTCIAHYELSGDYYAATLKALQPVLQEAPFDIYYCLLWPTWEYRNKYPMIFHTAGECDFQFVFESIIATRNPLGRISRIGSITSGACLPLASILSLLFNVFASFDVLSM